MHRARPLTDRHATREGQDASRPGATPPGSRATENPSRSSLSSLSTRTRPPWSMTTLSASRSASDTTIWTGNEMMVRGERLDWWPYETNRGSRYDPVADAWTETSQYGAPSARADHVAVWTGSEMIVWGGPDDEAVGRYDPATDSWRSTSTGGGPSVCPSKRLRGLDGNRNAPLGRPRWLPRSHGRLGEYPLRWRGTTEEVPQHRLDRKDDDPLGRYPRKAERWTDPGPAGSGTPVTARCGRQSRMRSPSASPPSRPFHRNKDVIFA